METILSLTCPLCLFFFSASRRALLITNVTLTFPPPLERRFGRYYHTKKSITPLSYDTGLYMHILRIEGLARPSLDPSSSPSNRRFDGFGTWGGEG